MTNRTSESLYQTMKFYHYYVNYPKSGSNHAVGWMTGKLGFDSLYGQRLFTSIIYNKTTR